MSATFRGRPGRRPKVMQDTPTPAHDEQPPRPQVYARHEAASAMPRYGQGHFLDMLRAPPGFHLSYARYLINGREDISNVQTKQFQGWVPVTAEEAEGYGWPNVSNFDFVSGDASTTGKRQKWATYQDVLVMKRPTAIGENERREKTRKAQSAIRALDENVFNALERSGARAVPREVTEDRMSIDPTSYE